MLVDVWTWPLDASADVVSKLFDLLSDDERARAGRLLRRLDGERFVVAHGRLRQLLGSVSGVAPEKLRFVVGRNGRPDLAGGGPRFSLSHSESFGALAIAPFRVGLDIEAVRPLRLSIADACFTAAERDDLRRVAEEDRLPALLRCWTRKEAVLKACGAGLSALDTVGVSLLADEPARVTSMAGPPGEAAAWRLEHLDLGPACIGAVAARRLGWSVRRWSGPPAEEYRLPLTGPGVGEGSAGGG